jgi:hypothetical protein
MARAGQPDEARACGLRYAGIALAVTDEQDLVRCEAGHGYGCVELGGLAVSRRPPVDAGQAAHQAVSVTELMNKWGAGAAADHHRNAGGDEALDGR